MRESLSVERKDAQLGFEQLYDSICIKKGLANAATGKINRTFATMSQKVLHDTTNRGIVASFQRVSQQPLLQRLPNGGCWWCTFPGFAEGCKAEGFVQGALPYDISAAR